MRKRISIIAASLILLFVSISPSMSVDPATPLAYQITVQADSSNDPHTDYSNFGFRLGLADFFNQGLTYPDIFGHGYAGTNGLPQKNDFNSYDGPIPGRAYLPPCISESDTPCIESVSTREVGTSTWQLGTVANTQPKIVYGALCGWCATSKTYEPFVSTPFDKTKQYGGYGSMWTLSQSAHGGGTDYRVDVQLNQSVANSVYGKCGLNPCTFMQIVPLKLGPSQSFEEVPGTSRPDYQMYDFPKNVEYRIILRLAGAELIKPDGFFFGRVENMSVVGGTDPFNRLTISGLPVRVPVAEVWPVPVLTIPAELRADWGGYLENGWSCKTEVHIGNCIMPVTFNGLNMVQHFGEWEKRGLKTVAETTMWELRATNPIVMPECSALWTQHVITGTLSTNATIYSSSVPTWDTESRSFAFTVASTHLAMDGQASRGYYQLALSVDLVKCLWGNDASAANAQIRIVSGNGTSQIATTNARQQDGIFYFTAANFEYSNPKLMVSFKTPIPSPKPTPEPTLSPGLTPSPSLPSGPIPSATATHVSKALKKPTITCVKGKVTKKITSAKPVCPTGWKKKS